MAEEQAVELTRKEKRYAKKKAKVLNPVDIKYRGPLSYRYLRVIAWMLFAIGQLIVLNNIFKWLGWNFLGAGGETAVDYLSSIASPLFIIASFGLALSGQKTHKQFLILYGAIFGGMIIGLNIFYYRYLVGFLGSKENASELLNGMNFLYKVNVFADLFIFSLFHFFTNYIPTKHFKGKKIVWFRLLVLIPIFYVLASYILKTLNNFGTIALPFAFIPFLLTKSPLVFALFATVSIWLKFRERYYINKIGVTREEYKRYLKTNRNSLSFSITLSTIVAIFVLIEFLIIIAFVIAYQSEPVEIIAYRLKFSSIGEVIAMILAIPFIFLYSYTRTHKPGAIDILVPFAGIGMTVIVYLETILHFIQMVR